MTVFNSLKFFFLFFVVLIVKGQEETSKHDSIDSFVSNSDILTKLKSYDELVRSLEIKLIDLELDVKEKSAEIEYLKSKILAKDKVDTTSQAPTTRPPTTQEQTTQPPTTQPPTQPSTTQPPTTQRPTTQPAPMTTTIPDDSIEERLQHLEELSKIHTLRSCHEYDEYGINTSGKYFIDPDGPLVGIEPFEVYCNFDDHSTEILHDYDAETTEKMPVEIDHCTEPHVCFRLDLTYPTKMEQIVSLIDLSENCTQEIRFNCFLAPLEVNGEAIGTWVNRNNGNETYFTGSNSGTHICECGLTDSCSDSEHLNTCNCDASELPIEQFDAGVITDMTALPIIGFNYGDLLQFPDQYASIEIGRLKCKGKKPLLPEEINDSCKNLKLNGESRSRNYPLNDGSLAFCDMTKRITDSEIQRKIGDFRFKEPM